MRKFFTFGLLFCVVLTSDVNAQEAVLSLSGDIIMEKENKKGSQPQPKPISVEERKADDKGVFSFMNVFSRKKTENKDTKETENIPQETPLQKMERLAGEGNLDAQMSLAYMYLYGEDGVDVDHKKAFKYYKMAAEQKDNVAINNLGSLYFSGIGTSRNSAMAAKMFALASELGNTEASLNLAFLYMSGTGVERNYRQAITLFSKAAETGNPTASFMLGYAYFKGFVVEKDLRRAFELIHTGAVGGYDDAQYVLSSLYLNGWGIPQNFKKAVVALNSAVSQGHVPAMVDLGNMLVKGDKYPADIYQAHILFNIASVRGAIGAAEMRDSLKKNMKIEDLLQAQAEAGRYKEKPSEMTLYVKNTFGENIKGYIDDGLIEQAKRTGKKK